MIVVSRFLCGLVDRPADRGAQRFSQHCSTGFADGRQPTKSPFLRTTLPELAHEQTVRQQDEVHLPGLTLAHFGTEESRSGQSPLPNSCLPSR